MSSQSIPCADCDAAKARFEARGFTVTGCAPDADHPDMCLISFTRPSQPLAMAMLQPAPMAPAPAAPIGQPAAAPAMAAAPAPVPGPLQAPVISPAGTPTSLQTRTAQAIVNIFETGQVLGDYGQVTLLPGDPGRLTFGRSQVTLGSGNLFKLLDIYVRNLGARFGSRFAPLLPRFQAEDGALDTDMKVQNLLRASADDPVMRDTQDSFFNDGFWKPALLAANKLGLRSPLAITVVYDSFVQGAWGTLRDTTTSDVGAPSAVGEQRWVSAYVKNRQTWLATNRLPILRKTTYRMDALQRLVDLDQWGLSLPLVVRGTEISVAALNAVPQGCYDGPAPGSRPLALQQPLARGLDVRLVQLALSDHGADIKADGVFGQGSQTCIKEAQIARGLPITGVADAALIGKLVN